MKHYKHLLLASLVTLAMTACNDSKKADENSTAETDAPVQTDGETKAPTCTIKEGTPKTDKSITVKVVCKEGTSTIESATVSLGNFSKNVDYEDANINDYLGFQDLEADTSYELTLEVLVGGETLTDSVTIKTKTASTTSASIVHNGTTYGTVTSPFTGKVWLDRNLGAARVCTSFNDTACYGDYYQWGRDFDGHEDSGSATTAVLAGDVNSAGSAFIIGSPDWALVDLTGGIRSANWSKTDGSSVCPVDFRVPTLTELRAETLDEDVTNRDTAFTNFLKLPSAGNRIRIDGSMIGVGSWGDVWASSVNGNRSHGVNFRPGLAFWYNTTRARGLSVRCLRD